MKNVKRFVIIALAMTMLINPVNVEAKKKSNVTIKKVKVNNNKLEIKLKVKKAKKIKGYQIRIATKKNMKGALKVTTKKAVVNLKKLKASRTYYVQVRTFKKVNGKKVYSNWSSKKKVRTKSRIKVNKVTVKYEDGSEVQVDGNGNVIHTDACNHEWVEKYETVSKGYWKKELVEEGYTTQLPITEARCVHICSTCGADITNEDESQHVKNHMLEDPENAKGYYTTYEYVIIGYRDVVVEPRYEDVWTIETEEVLAGYECSKCHCTKQ